MDGVEKEHKKRSIKRIVKLGDKLNKLNRTLSPLLTSITYITQHSLKFIRWLRVSLESNTPVTQAMERLGLDLVATFKGFLATDECNCPDSTHVLTLTANYGSCFLVLD